MKKSLREGLDLKVALTALVSAIIGGLVATGLVYLGVLGLEEGPGHVTINEAPAVSSGGWTLAAGRVPRCARCTPTTVRGW
jgi:hypothetical protein